MTDDMINEAARVVLARQNGVEDYDPNPWELPPFRALAEAGLLANPEQAAELASLKDQVEQQHEINAGWVAYKHRKAGERVRHVEQFEEALGLEPDPRGANYWYERMIEAAAKVRKERDRLKAVLSATQGAKQEWNTLASTGVTAATRWKAERDLLQARIDALNRWLRAEVIVGWIQPRGYRQRYLAEDVIRGLLAGDPIAEDQASSHASPLPANGEANDEAGPT